MLISSERNILKNYESKNSLVTVKQKCEEYEKNLPQNLRLFFSSIKVSECFICKGHDTRTPKLLLNDISPKLISDLLKKK